MFYGKKCMGYEWKIPMDVHQRVTLRLSAALEILNRSTTRWFLKSGLIMLARIFRKNSVFKIIRSFIIFFDYEFEVAFS